MPPPTEAPSAANVGTVVTVCLSLVLVLILALDIVTYGTKNTHHAYRPEHRALMPQGRRHMPKSNVKPDCVPAPQYAAPPVVHPSYGGSQHGYSIHGNKSPDWEDRSDWSDSPTGSDAPLLSNHRPPIPRYPGFRSYSSHRYPRQGERTLYSSAQHPVPFPVPHQPTANMNTSVSGRQPGLPGHTGEIKHVHFASLQPIAEATPHYYSNASSISPPLSHTRMSNVEKTHHSTKKHKR